eukprot:jgi/Chrzof1/9070/Cz03g35010.t1
MLNQASEDLNKAQLDFANGQLEVSRTIFDNVEIARQKELKKTVEWQQPNADLRRMKSGKWGTFNMMGKLKPVASMQAIGSVSFGRSAGSQLAGSKSGNYGTYDYDDDEDGVSDEEDDDNDCEGKRPPGWRHFVADHRKSKRLREQRAEEAATTIQAAWKGWKQRRYRKASEALQQTLGELHVATILEQQPEACNGEQQPTDLTQAEADDPTAAVPKQQQQHETHIQILTHMLDPQTFSVSSPKDAGPASPSKHATGPATKARFKALNTAARAARRFGHQPAMAAQSGSGETPGPTGPVQPHAHALSKKHAASTHQPTFDSASGRRSAMGIFGSHQPQTSPTTHTEQGIIHVQQQQQHQDDTSMDSAAAPASSGHGQGSSKSGLTGLADMGMGLIRQLSSSIGRLIRRTSSFGNSKTHKEDGSVGHADTDGLLRKGLAGGRRGIHEGMTVEHSGKQGNGQQPMHAQNEADMQSKQSTIHSDSSSKTAAAHEAYTSGDSSNMSTLLGNPFSALASSSTSSLMGIHEGMAVEHRGKQGSGSQPMHAQNEADMQSKHSTTRSDPSSQTAAAHVACTSGDSLDMSTLLGQPFDALASRSTTFSRSTTADLECVGAYRRADSSPLLQDSSVLLPPGISSPSNLSPTKKRWLSVKARAFSAKMLKDLTPVVEANVTLAIMGASRGTAAHSAKYNIQEPTSTNSRPQSAATTAAAKDKAAGIVNRIMSAMPGREKHQSKQTTGNPRQQTDGMVVISNNNTAHVPCKPEEAVVSSSTVPDLAGQAEETVQINQNATAVSGRDHRSSASNKGLCQSSSVEAVIADTSTPTQLLPNARQSLQTQLPTLLVTGPSTPSVAASSPAAHQLTTPPAIDNHRRSPSPVPRSNLGFESPSRLGTPGLHRAGSKESVWSDALEPKSNLAAKSMLLQDPLSPYSATIKQAARKELGIEHRPLRVSMSDSFGSSSGSPLSPSLTCLSSINKLRPIPPSKSPTPGAVPQSKGSRLPTTGSTMGLTAAAVVIEGAGAVHRQASQQAPHNFLHTATGSPLATRSTAHETIQQLKTAYCQDSHNPLRSSTLSKGSVAAASSMSQSSTSNSQNDMPMPTRSAKSFTAAQEALSHPGKPHVRPAFQMDKPLASPVGSSNKPCKPGALYMQPAGHAPSSHTCQQHQHQHKHQPKQAAAEQIPDKLRVVGGKKVGGMHLPYVLPRLSKE